MLQIHVEEKPPEIKDDLLLVCLEQLGEALAADFSGNEPNWTRQVWSAVAFLESALRQHVQTAQTADGLLVGLDRTRPTLVRHWDGLRQQSRNHLEQTAALKWELHRAMEAFPPDAASRGYAMDLAEPPQSQPPPDFKALRRRAEQLAADLRRYEKIEGELIQESVSSDDIGVGD